MRFPWNISAAFLLISFASVTYAERSINVPLGGGQVINLGGIRGAAQMTDPTIATFKPYGRDVFISGKKLGETKLLVKGASTHEEWVIQVVMPTMNLQAELDRMFSRERVSVRALGGSMVLTGTVSSVNRVQEIEDVVMGYLQSPRFADVGLQPHVINMLTVKTPQQVQLEVKFAEVNRRSFRELGSNLNVGYKTGDIGTSGSASIGEGAVNSVTQNVNNNAVVDPFKALPQANSFGTFFFGTQFGSFPFAATLSMLAQHNLSRTLAEPTLVAMSGEQANFLAGGEIPFQKSVGLNDVSVEFKQFGVELAFKPTVLGDSTVQLRTTVALSAPDQTFSLRNAAGISTFAFKRRSSETTVRLKDGQSFAIAGLLRDELSKVAASVPGLSSLPILGILFKSKQFERLETELVVVVTVRLVDPVDAADLPPLPGADRPTDPTDLQMFLLNIDEPAPQPGRRRGRRPSGTLGFQR
ncbi:MAG: hypothetical protein VX589_07090 [Myxococcota bacterium]|nr:hypothetical protein [Myxococcota bacterium]